MTQTDQQNVPKLRFQDVTGNDFPDWEEKRLGEIVTAFSGGTPSSSNRSYYAGDIPFIGSGDISAAQVEQCISEEALASSSAKLVNEGDLLYALYGATSGEVAIAQFSGAINQAVLCIRSDENILFLFQWLRYSKAKITSTYLQGGQGNLSGKIVKTLRIPLPHPDEQRKVAAFLGAVDTKIAQLARKKALLEDYKKGCMQRLFSQAVRFKKEDGNDFPDWEEKRFGEVFSWVSTNSLSRERLTLEGGQVQNIHYGDIHTKFAAIFSQKVEVIPFIKDSSPDEFKPEQFCQVGDLVIADASEDYADIGKAIEIVELGDVPLVAGLHTYIARPYEGSVQTGFSGYLLRSAAMRRQTERIAQGISVLGISKRNLEKLTFFLPHPAEQRKIADFLSALDREIDLVGQELTHVRRFKQGLLQQMFV